MNHRGVAGAIALLLVRGAGAQTTDLVAHNGFEACWSQASTEAAFLSLLQTSIDGQSACIPPTSGSGYTACYTAACGGGNLGCPVTIHAGAFGGDFATGAFSAPGTADDVVVPLDLGALGQCSVTISNIGVTYAPAFFVTADGNAGAFMAYLTGASKVTLDSDTVGGDALCSSALGGLLTDNLKAVVEQEATAQMIATLSTTAAGRSVCPLTP